MNTKPKIAILGAGPGGLMLARLLHLHAIDVTVFEKETHALQRPQGGTLDLHAETGLAALAQAGLMAAFQTIARVDDQGSRLVDMHAQLLFDDAGEHDKSRPEVDRTALRAMLLDALPKTCVRWNCGRLQIIQADASRWRLIDEQGTAEDFDLIVGADGTWSSVRPLLSPYQPHYSGLSFIEFGIDDVDSKHPAIAQLVGHGKMGVEGNGMSIIAQRNGNAHIRGYAIFRVPTDWPQRRFDLSTPEAVKSALLKEFDGFASTILDLIRASNGQFAVRPIYALPIGHCWPHRSGLTLLGDAAHVMSPFGGEGVNNALFDAAELARLLIARAHWDEAVAEYESLMFVRVAAAAQAAAEAAATFLSHDGQALTLEMYRSHLG